MIKRSKAAEGIRVTFTLAGDSPVSVVGDFNGWDPLIHPLKQRANGTRSVSVVLPPGTRTTFRYLEDGGRFFDDPDADSLEDNGCGATHGVLIIAAAKSAAVNGTKRAAPAAKTVAATPAAAATAAPATKPPSPAKAGASTKAPTAAAPAKSPKTKSGR